MRGEKIYYDAIFVFVFSTECAEIHIKCRKINFFLSFCTKSKIIFCLESVGVFNLFMSVKQRGKRKKEILKCRLTFCIRPTMLI